MISLSFLSGYISLRQNRARKRSFTLPGKLPKREGGLQLSGGLFSALSSGRSVFLFIFLRMTDSRALCAGFLRQGRGSRLVTPRAALPSSPPFPFRRPPSQAYILLSRG